jgi:hypothetical protein
LRSQPLTDAAVVALTFDNHFDASLAQQGIETTS